MTHILTTDRLFLRPHQPDDASFMMQLNSDPEVVRYTGDTAFADLAEAEQIILSLQQQYAARKMGRFIVIEQSTNQPIGWCGLKWHEDRQVADIGYRFLRAHWGKGYATEAARACLDYGFNTLKLDGIIARSDPRNEGSLAVISRLGMQPCGTGRDGDFHYLEFECGNS